MGRIQSARRRGFALAILAAAPGSAAAQVIIVDNTDAGFSVLTQSWSSATGSGAYGADYRYRSTSGAEGIVAWRPDLPASGSYAVAAWYRSTGPGRPDDAPYTIRHANGSATVLVNQQINGSSWVPLGVYAFDAGSGGSVELSSTAQPGKTIVADAIRFTAVQVGDSVPELRACWLTQYQYLGKTTTQLRQIAQHIRGGGMNTVYVAAYSGAKTYWPSKAYRAAGGHWGSPSRDVLAELVDIFHEEGLKVGARFEYGMAVGFANHPVALEHPDWLARDINGDAVTGENGGFVFLSPSHPEVVTLLAEMAAELAANYSFDDIQLDRFRWGRKTIGVGREYGYEAVTASLYASIHGGPPPSDRNQPTWVVFREGLVNDAVAEAYAAVKAVNPRIVVSAAPTGSYGITQHMQRWSAWVEGGYMDVVMPQMYQTSLNAFIGELGTQMNQAPGHLDRLAVALRAQDDHDAGLVASLLSHARGEGIHHGALWVYHQYTSQIAIADEIDLLPQPDQPWEFSATNAFTDDRLIQIIIDDEAGLPALSLSGAWVASAQPGFFKFGSRVAAGDASATASFRSRVPFDGRYAVYVWYTAASNRHPAAPYAVHHFNGETVVEVDQRQGGGGWVSLGRFVFAAGDVLPRVTLSNTGAADDAYTSADGVKLVWEGYALGDANGDGAVDNTDFELAVPCFAGPGFAYADPACAAFDVDDDGDLDLADYAAMFARVGD